MPAPSRELPGSIITLLVALALAVTLLCPAAESNQPNDKKAGVPMSWLRESIKLIDQSKAPAGVPFSFTYDGKAVGGDMKGWEFERISEKTDGGVTSGVISFTDPKTGLRIICQTKSFEKYPAAEWLISFENTGDKDAPIIENIQALDITLACPEKGDRQYVLHRTNGAPSNPSDFEMRETALNSGSREVMSGAGGRSSNGDFPFFRIDTARGAVIVAVGWSGQWKAEVTCEGTGSLHVSSGIELTHFKLHPGEKVRMPRMLVLFHEGDQIESNSQFRRLLREHYLAKYKGKRHDPILYCNTCFTRGGGWLNECNEENQISLIEALAPLKVEAVITDAGWFIGGWPMGAGNWDPDPEKYPNGMAPVAAAARDNGMIYGLWFEPERVIAGTAIAREHPEWLLWHKGDDTTALLDFALPEVQEYFFNIVDGFMKLDGFKAYRQDFNMDPLMHWRDNDEPDRQGIHEIKYIEGLYAYWDRIIGKYPGCFMVECASGGRRIDLETIVRLHVHQKSDHWFDNVADQASLMGISQYLPNGVVMAPINRFDDYTFHSAMACSLCLGWIADGEDFDVERGKELTHQYVAVRDLLNKDWYPLTPYNRDQSSWIGSQYNDPEEGRGMVLVFRRDKSPYVSLMVRLHGLDAGAIYELTSGTSGLNAEHTGAELMKGLEVTLESAPSSDLITYRKK